MSLLKKITSRLRSWKTPANIPSAPSPFFRVLHDGLEIKIISDLSQGAEDTYKEIVTEDGYGIFKDFKEGLSHKTIVDIGANIGIFTMVGSLLYPHAEIYAYEPYPEAYNYLSQNAENHSNIKIFNRAVSDRKGTAHMEKVPYSTLARTGETGDVEVQMISATDILPGKEIDLLKMDCEGAEWPIMRKTDLVERAKYLRLEYHLLNGEKKEEALSLLAAKKHQILFHLEGSWRRGLIWSKRSD